MVVVFLFVVGSEHAESFFIGFRAHMCRRPVGLKFRANSAFFVVTTRSVFCSFVLPVFGVGGLVG